MEMNSDLASSSRFSSSLDFANSSARKEIFSLFLASRTTKLTSKNPKTAARASIEYSKRKPEKFRGETSQIKIKMIKKITKRLAVIIFILKNLYFIRLKLRSKISAGYQCFNQP